MSLRNIDYTDRELLLVIADTRDEDGMASTLDVAMALGLSENGEGPTPAQKIAARLSWMSRYGLLTRTQREDGKQRWMITPIGETIMHGRLSATAQRTVEGLDAGAQVLAMRTLTRRAYLEASEEVAVAVKREYLHQVAKRQVGWRARRAR